MLLEFIHIGSIVLECFLASHVGHFDSFISYCDKLIISGLCVGILRVWKQGEVLQIFIIFFLNLGDWFSDFGVKFEGFPVLRKISSLER